MDKDHYTIGEVSKLCNIPIRTLHYYDEIGLLKPAKKDDINGYRYYAKNQLLHVNIINQFKVQGYSIKEMKERFASHTLTISEEALYSKRAEIRKNIEDLIILEKRLNQYLDAFSYQDHKQHIKLKEIPKMHVAYIREKGSADAVGFMKRFASLQTLLTNKKLLAEGTVMAIYYDDYNVYDPLNADIEVCVQVHSSCEIEGYVRAFGGFQVVSAIHYGAYRNESQTYALMMGWMKENSLEMCGSAIENYLIDAILTENEDEYITELMIPVNKIG